MLWWILKFWFKYFGEGCTGPKGQNILITKKGGWNPQETSACSYKSHFENQSVKVLEFAEMVTDWCTDVFCDGNDIVPLLRLPLMCIV